MESERERPVITVLKEQHRSELEFTLYCGLCGKFAIYSAILVPADTAKSVRCDDCRAKERLARGYAKAARVKKFKAAQITMPWLEGEDK